MDIDNPWRNYTFSLSPSSYFSISFSMNMYLYLEKVKISSDWESRNLCSHSSGWNIRHRQQQVQRSWETALPRTCCMSCSCNNPFISIMTTVLSFAEKSCSLKILFFEVISVENNNSHSCLEDLSHCNIKNSLDSHPTCRVSEKSFWIWRSRISLYCVVPKEIGPWVLQPRQDIDSLTQSCFASVKLPMITLFSSILCWWDSLLSLCSLAFLTAMRNYYSSDHGFILGSQADCPRTIFV